MLRIWYLYRGADMRDVRVLCRWPEWQHYRKALIASGKVNEEKLSELELTSELDSLDVVELIIGMEQAFGVEYTEPPKVDLVGRGK
jgi:hypothetical protein